MRTLFVNGGFASVNHGCGFRPIIHRCLVKTWATEHGFKYSTFLRDFDDVELSFEAPNANTAEIVEQIQRICDGCRYRTKETKAR